MLVRIHHFGCQEQICDLWPACDLTILTPHSAMGRSWWAECDPSDAEVISHRICEGVVGSPESLSHDHVSSRVPLRVSACKHHEPDHRAEVSRNENRGMSREEAELAAWRWTWRVRMDQMEEVLAMVMRSLTGAPLTVIGISNGAAVAAELALRVPVCSMWLASGVPAEVHGSAADAGKSVKRL